MNISEMLMKIDHTNLKTTATLEDIYRLWDQAYRYKFASICIPPCYVMEATKYSKGRVKICSVVGFPLGYSTTDNKVEEAKELISQGADEIDMVINIAKLKNKEYDLIGREIGKVKSVVGDKTLKVIVETCLLTEEEKIKMCQILSREGADYIKTSTGFSTEGAKIEDIILFRENIGPKLKIKASGDIRTAGQVRAFIEAGVDRVGMSSAMSAFDLD